MTTDSHKTPGDNDDTRPPAARTRRRIIQALQILLAGVLIYLIVSYVQIWDTAVVPEGGPLAGNYSGEVTRTGERLVFQADDSPIAIEYDLSEGEILTASLVKEDGTRERLTGQRLQDLELPKEGLVSILERTDPVYYAQALLVYLLAYVCAFARWKLLLDAAGLPTSLGKATRMSCIGLFFNNVVPGLTGGDLVKAYYVVRENRQNKTDAVITVIIDRIMGITVLAGFSAVTVLTDLSSYWEVALSIYLFLAAVIAAAMVFYSRRLRRFFRLDAIISRLPFEDLIRKVDRAAFLYRYRKRTIVACLILTAGVHVSVIVSVWLLGRGLGLDVSLVTYAILIPIILIVSALPITPAGWGVGEMAFVSFFNFAGVPAVMALALSFIHRFNTLLISLSGAVFLLFGGGRTAREIIDEAENDGSAEDVGSAAEGEEGEVSR